MNKRILFSVVAVLVLTAGVGFAIWQSNYDDNDTNGEYVDDFLTEDYKDQPPVTEDEENNDEDQKPDEQNEPTEQSPPPSNAAVTLNNFGQQSPGDTVFATATVSNVVEGNCQFRFRNNGVRFNKTVPIERTPTGYYACAFRASASEFSPKGSWSVRAYLPDEGPEAYSQERSTEIR